MSRKGTVEHMMWYRVALRRNHAAPWCWKSPLYNSLRGVLGILDLYRAVPKGHIRVFLFTSTEQMDVMLERANQGKQSTAIIVKQLWDAHSINWMQVRRLEIELGEGGDHDQPYDGHMPSTHIQTLAWTRLLARRACGELLS